MQLTFEALERALAPIEELGKEELVFPINGIPITLRSLVPEEETEVHRFASANNKDGEDSLAVANSFLERLKLGILSYAIVAVGEQDFHGIDFVETDEEIKEGKKVRIPKHLALRDLLKRWPGAIRMAIFRKYVELQNKVETKAEEAIQFEPSDLDAEIDRLEKKLVALKEQKEQVKAPAASSFSGMVKAAEEVDRLHQRPEMNTEEDTEASKPEAPQPVHPAAVKPPPVAPTGPRQPIIPTQGVPPMSTPVEAPTEPQQQKQQAAFTPPPPEEESMVDLSDSEAVEAAMARETARILARRRGMAVPENPSATSARFAARPPHLDAVEADKLSSGSLPVGVPQDSVVRFPAQELTGKEERGTQATAAQVLNQVPGNEQSRNPRFRGPQKL